MNIFVQSDSDCNVRKPRKGLLWCIYLSKFPNPESLKKRQVSKCIVELEGWLHRQSRPDDAIKAKAEWVMLMLTDVRCASQVNDASGPYLIHSAVSTSGHTAVKTVRNRANGHVRVPAVTLRRSGIGLISKNQGSMPTQVQTNTYLRGG